MNGAHRRGTNLHNTSRHCPLDGRVRLGLSPAPCLLPRSRFRAYHSLLGQSRFVLSGFLAFLSRLSCGRFLGWCIVVLSLCAAFLVCIIRRNPGTPLVLSPTPHHVPPSEPGTWGDLWSAALHLPATGPAAAPHAPLRAAEGRRGPGE